MSLLHRAGPVCKDVQYYVVVDDEFIVGALLGLFNSEIHVVVRENERPPLGFFVALIGLSIVDSIQEFIDIC
jgi:hypothetical protein